MTSEKSSILVPESPEILETESFLTDQDVVPESFCEPSVIFVPLDYEIPLPATPKKSILRPPGFSTPLEERKRVSFHRRSMSAANLTAACSPAYEDRKSILKDEMADATFFLEKSIDKLRFGGSPGSAARNNPSTSRQSSPGPSTAWDAPANFRISTYVSKLTSSSVIRKSFSSSSLNTLGVHSSSEFGRSPRADLSTSTNDIFVYEAKDCNDFHRMVLQKGSTRTYFATPPSRLSMSPETSSNSRIRKNYFATPPSRMSMSPETSSNSRTRKNYFATPPTRASPLPGFSNHTHQRRNSIATPPLPGYSNHSPLINRVGTPSFTESPKLKGNGTPCISKLK